MKLDQVVRGDRDEGWLVPADRIIGVSTESYELTTHRADPRHPVPSRSSLTRSLDHSGRWRHVMVEGLPSPPPFSKDMTPTLFIEASTLAELQGESQ